MNWYEVNNIDQVDSPALLVYPDRIQHNIAAMINTVGGNTQRLMPHVKTHKMGAVVKMQLEAGISRFKCATIAELEMALDAGAKHVLISYQLIGPKVARFIQLVKKFPDAVVASLVDDLTVAQQLDAAFGAEGLQAQVYIDINNGQNRTGAQLNDHTFELYQAIAALKHVQIRGLHIYDGHIRDVKVEDRVAHSDSDFSPVYALLQQIAAAGFPKPEIINGGSPSFFPASLREEVFCSPGTTLLWDWGYSTFVGEVGVEWAALLLTRVISKPAPGRITTDLGHKSVGSENPLDKRIKFLNLTDYEPVGQNEEHLILTVKDWDAIRIGDVLYGVPYHICPSVALHDVAYVIRDHQWTEIWPVTARTRKITV